ncbi:DUF4871 domain-containing protein [Geobacillus sp. 44B]|jgi:hypothetical protein|nr:DUF4871 domain-containing protein [Geobacillus sp. 44B]QNU37527.1 DUF4871 domain-containing protein [Geobacillus sp. 44B]
MYTEGERNVRGMERKIRSIYCLLAAVIVFALASCSEEARRQTRDTESHTEETSVAETSPVHVDKKVIRNIDWRVSPVFSSGDYQMRGVPNKVAFIDAPFVANQNGKYMWHFWGDSIPEGKLTIVAVQEGSGAITPALTLDGKSVWTTGELGGPNNGADAHLPSNMMLGERGKWALLVYIGDTFWDYVVVEVK